MFWLRFNSITLDRGFKSLGCWKDGEVSAIDGYEGNASLEGCYKQAKLYGFTHFAVQDGGMCFTSPIAGKTYKKYGSVDDCCSEDGTGGIRCQEVYIIE